MSDSVKFSLADLNRIISHLVENYEKEMKGWSEYNKLERERFMAKIEALNELKIEINEPKPIVNVSENVQQTSNVITTQNIVNDGL